MKVPGYSACNPNKILIGRYCIIDHNIFEIESLSQFCHIYWPSILKYYIFVCKENFPFFLYVQFQVTAGTWYYLSLPVPVQIGAVSTGTGTKIGRPGLYDGCIYANTSIWSVQLRILILLIDEHRGTDWVIDRCYCGVSKIAISPLSFVTFGTGDKYPSQMLRQKVTTFLILVVCSWYLASMVYRENGRIYANTSILSVQLILLIDEHRGTDWVIDRCYYGVSRENGGIDANNWSCARRCDIVFRKKRLLLRKRPQGNYVPVFWTRAWTVLRLSTDICTAFSKFGQCQRGGGAQQVRGAPRSPGQIGRIWAAMAITVGKFGTPVLFFLPFGPIALNA